MNNHAERREKALSRVKGAVDKVSDLETKAAFMCVIDDLELAHMGLDDSFCKIDEITERLDGIADTVNEIKEAQNQTTKAINDLKLISVESIKKDSVRGKKEKMRSYVIIITTVLSFAFLIYQVFGSNRAVGEMMSLANMLSSVIKNIPLIAL